MKQLISRTEVYSGPRGERHSRIVETRTDWRDILDGVECEDCNLAVGEEVCPDCRDAVIDAHKANHVYACLPWEDQEIVDKAIRYADPDGSFDISARTKALTRAIAAVLCAKEAGNV